MTSGQDVYLVTGAMGCIGAWTLHHLIKQGERVVSFDLSEDRGRLDLLLEREEQAAITFIKGDLTDPAQVTEAVQAQKVTRIIHLAALQVPFCRANPVQGARVNVVGTVNVFEAARAAGLKHVTIASSIAVYGPPSDYAPGLMAHDAPHGPRTLYGVYKSAGEGIACVYAEENGIHSTSLRPYTVYGVARDQGLTSEPTKAMLAAAEGKPFAISFGGRMQFQLASDVALQFIEAARHPLEGAQAFNLGGPVTAVSEVARLIREVRPAAQIDVSEKALAFPEGFDDSALRGAFKQVHETPLEVGIQLTIEHFESALRRGLVRGA